MSTLVGIAEAAALLGISQQQTRVLCRTGKVKSSKVGSSWIMSEKDLKEYGLKTSHITAKNHVSMNKNPDKPIALSFFSGAMGLDIGIEKAGFEILLACEVDKHCRQTIHLNRPDTALIEDINDYSATDVIRYAGVENKDVDLIIGGPPCQAFSTAGKRKGFNDDRGNAFLKYLDIALEIRPKFIVIENVRGLLSCPMSHRPHDQRGEGYPELRLDEMRGGALNFVLSRLKSNGYGYSFNLYNAANFGTPQNRERVVIVCSRDGEKPPFLTPTHSDDGDYGLPKWNTFREAVKGIQEHHHLTFPEKRLKYYRMLGPGQNWRNLDIEHQKEAMGKSFYSGGGKTGFLRRLAWDKPSPTLVTHPAMPATDLSHPEEDRPLSIEEYKRLQEFPDNWVLAGPLIEQYKQVGNAVPVSLGLAIGKHVLGLIKGDFIDNYSGFKFSRYKRTDTDGWLADFNRMANHSTKTKNLQEELAL